VIAGLTRTSDLVYGDGVAPLAQTDFSPGQRICQQPIVLPDGSRFERVRLFAGARGTPGPPLEVSIGSRTARLPGGYGAHTALLAPLGGGEGSLRVCVRNVGDRPATIWGSSARNGTSASAATLDGKPVDYDVSLRFERETPRSLLALVPAIGERASQFKPGVVSSGSLLALALIVLLGVPVLLVVALNRS
jgi:hypothetical protein